MGKQVSYAYTMPPKNDHHTATAKQTLPFQIGGISFLQQLENLLEPLVLAITVCGVGLFVDGRLDASILLLAILMFFVAWPGHNRLALPLLDSILDILWLYAALVLVVFACDFLLPLKDWLPLNAVLHWLWITPLAQTFVHLLFRAFASTLARFSNKKRRAVLVGISEQGRVLAERILRSPYHDVELLGYFDDRPPERLPPLPIDLPCLGNFTSLAVFCKEKDVQFIYISLPLFQPIQQLPRVTDLLDNLRNTTASIYFVPDAFVTDLVQGRIGQICNVPVIATCESPFTGFDGILKRGFDLLFSLCALILLLPVFLLIALAIRCESPGPVFFRQRRHGLNGEEIVIYKFRSMRVCEDGANIPQATQNDPRVTRLGAFLRRTSLDELPQFVNVLQGRMSVVGPRPHALAHNAFYRSQIQGYMMRHKVRPGITGWAQVNGLRGETKTVEKMRQRIDYDLDYLRHWSLGLDFKILLLTVLLVFRDRHAW